ncbi:hypothetical protein H2Y56_22165 [Pectobacterium aroidearum]|uniref:Origin of replication binding family protein n=2 Tax=Pectobacterium aroidearum TaxID=1201031 RepID=A0ABR5ZJN2_9GAMM|nr:plasmid replication protein, CyRepA1 family [Pectobacterium aroidearum]MBA5234790.1 hypothetical protein [Pectobacterium aroidearum]
MKITDFYQQKFNSDPFELLDEAYSELVSIAAAAGINWKECASEIQLTPFRTPDAEKFSKYTGHGPAVTDIKLKGKVNIYSRLETTPDGIKYPFINFVTKGKDSGVWTGIQFLWAEYRRHIESNGGTTVPLSEKELEHRARAEKRRIEREEQQRVSGLMNNQLRASDLQEYLNFHRAFSNGPIEDGSHSYAIKKGIESIFSACNVRRVSMWDRGHSGNVLNKRECMAIPLSHIDGRFNGQIIGWQRIFSNGAKIQTRAVDMGTGQETPPPFSGSCHVIGRLRGAKRVCVVEGFATGASVYIAAKKRFDAVIVAIAANNMIRVVEQLDAVYPGLELWCALDNDHQAARAGKGNTGIKAGIDIMKKYPNVRCTRPLFSETENFSDFNDLMVSRGIAETNRQLFSKENALKLSSHPFDAELLALTVAPTGKQHRRAFSRQLIACIDAGMLLCPSKLSPKELIAMISNQIKIIGADGAFRSTVISRVKRRFEQKCQNSQGFRSFSERITNAAIRPDHITYKRFNTSQITPEVLAYIKSLNGPVIVRAGMGSGKSKHLLRPLMHSSERGVSVAHRVSLIGGLWDMMTRDDNGQRMKTDILHYQDPGAADIAPHSEKVTICINSTIKGCWRPLMTRHDFFGLDEATQGLRATLSGKAMAHPVDVFNRLIDSIAVTDDHALLVDADASDILVDVCELALARRENMGLSTWTQIHVVELPVDVTYEKDGARAARRVLYTDTNRIMVEVLKSVDAGEKFLLATDSTNFAEQLLLQLRERWPDKKWLYVSQDTKPDQEVIDFTDSPNTRAQLYDGLIYSPAISSGVSIETKHFTRHFGSFCGQVVPSDAIQMLRRDRTATEFMVGLGQIPGRKEENAESIKRGFLQALLDTADINEEFTDAILDGDRLSLGLSDTTYVKLKFKIAAMEAKARNDFANNFICILFSDGYDVQHLSENEALSEAGKTLRKDSKERVWDMTVLRHIEAETPSETQRDELLAKRSLSETEQAQLARWDIENELKLDVNEQSLAFLMDRGKKKLTLAELMTMDEMTAARIDRDEQAIVFTYQFKRGHKTEFVTVTALNRETADAQFGRMQPGVTGYSVQTRPVVEVTQRTFASLHRKAARLYFSTCGIDPDTGTGEATPDGMKAAMEQLMNADRKDEFNNVLRFGGYISKNGKPKRPETVFKQICESFGYSAANRRQTRAQGLKYVWSIKPESWSFIHGILARRAESSLSFCGHKLDAPVAAADDLTLGSNIDIRSQVGSLDIAAATEFESIEEAMAGLPIPTAWVRATLTLAEIKDLAMLPLRLIQATISGLYMSENMDLLTAGQYDELKRLQVC